MKNSGSDNSCIKLPIATADGNFRAHYSAHGLAALDFPRQTQVKRTNSLPPAAPSQPVKAWHQLATRALGRMLTGQPPGKLPPLDLSAGTEFQQRVWGELLKIAPGRTRNYGEIAKIIGKPKAVRAVGGACGANPIPVLVPCHRVLAANGKLGGFSGGLGWKLKLLAYEGIRIGG